MIPHDSLAAMHFRPGYGSRRIRSPAIVAPARKKEEL